MKALEHLKFAQIPNKSMKIIFGGESLKYCNTETGNPVTDKCLDTTSTTSTDTGELVSSGSITCCEK